MPSFLNIFLISLILSQVVILGLQAALSDSCPDPVYRSDQNIQDLVSKLKAATYSKEMMIVLQTEVPKDPHVFNGKQILLILDTVVYIDSKKESLKIMSQYIQLLTADEIIGVLNNINYSSPKLDLLPSIAFFLNDASLANKQKIVDKAFTFSSDKDQATKILAPIASRNCVYGTITEKACVFVIDISPSMKYTFKNKVGETISRLKFVQTQLTATISEQLKEYQKFNVIVFGESQKQWQSDLVNANAANIQSAVTYINQLGEIGATNISGAIEKAFQTKENLEAIYFLSDGLPNSGITDKNAMQKRITDLNYARTTQNKFQVKIHVTSFMLGGSETQQEKKMAKEFMEVLATSSQGSFRDMSGVQ